MSEGFNLRKKIRSIKLTRQAFIILLIVSLLLLVAFLSLGGSETLRFDDQRPDVVFRNRPRQLNAPELGQNFTGGDNLPSFNPPAGAIEGIGGDISLPTDAPGVGDNPIGPTNPGGGIPSFPTGQNPTFPTGGPNPPTFPTINTQPEDQPANTENNDPLNLPQRPNKARNLPNISRYDFIPQINLGFADKILAKLNLSLENLLFMFVLLGIMYYPLVGVNNILSQLKKAGEEEEDIFFRPTITEEELRRAEARQRRLKSFASHIEDLVQRTKGRRKSMEPQDIIILTYHELDDAFNDFAKLKRSRDLTPLEHSKIEFETGEINNEALINIVDLFYQARFGHKDLEDPHIEDLLFNLYSLVNQEVIQQRDEQLSRWRLFR